MDARHFDQLARILSHAGARRGMLQFLTAFPLLGGLTALISEDEAAAKGRRKRRKKAHKHGKGRHKGKHQKTCKPKSHAKTCAGKCGTVKNTCKKTVDCGACTCDPACLECFTCQVQPGEPGSCVPTPGVDCGEGQICQSDGACACDASSCGACRTCGSDGACEGCDGCCDGDHCVSDCPACHICESGTCIPCPDCCGSTCCPQDESCCGTACTDLQSDPDHCGACGAACGPGQICQDGGCGVVCGGEFCPAATGICDVGTCQVCTVTCPDGDCAGNALQTVLAGGGTVVVCPGRYTGNFTLSQAVTLIGAGEGTDPASNTILDAVGTGGVILVIPGATVTLRNLRITGGNEDRGSGIVNQGNLTLTACTVAQNGAPRSGGAQFGGGIDNQEVGTITLTDCTVTENSAEIGGGINQNSSGEITLDNTVVSLNAARSGGGIIVAFGTLNVNNGSTIIENTAPGGFGGGIAVGLATVIFDGSGGVTENTAGSGGGIFNQGGTVTLNGTEVSGNTPNNCAGDPVVGCMG